MASVEPGAQPAGSETLQLVQRVLAEFLAETGGPPVASIEPSQQLSEFAVDSVRLLQLHARLSDALGVELDASVFFDYDTVAALAYHLADLRLANCQ